MRPRIMRHFHTASRVTVCKMPGAGMYRRSLPSPPAIDFSSPEGKKLFTEALHKGNMEGFFTLISHFQTQSEPAYSGLASLAMVLNALAIDPCRKWKGPWRWFDQTMLDCCEPLENVKVKGISFGKVICLAHCAGASVKALRTNQSSIDEFRKYVIACSISNNCHVISSYNRRVFKQTGAGHFSPIGGYHAESDMVLILDVARFEYPCHWVPLSLLWEAMDTVVGTTGLHRGFMLMSKRQRAPALLYTMSCKHESWISTAKYLMDDVPVLLSSDNLKDITDVISAIFSSLPSEFAEFVKWVAELRREEVGGEAPCQEDKRRLDLKAVTIVPIRESEIESRDSENKRSRKKTDYLEAENKILEEFAIDSAGRALVEISNNIPKPPSPYFVKLEPPPPPPRLTAAQTKATAPLPPPMPPKASNSSPAAKKEEVLKLVQETSLYKHVTETLFSQNPFSPTVKEKLCHRDHFPNIEAASGCCQEEKGKTRLWCGEIPLCQREPISITFDSSYMHPASSDIFLTALLFALPPQTWSDLKDEQVRNEITGLVSTNSLSSLLQDEILHMRNQLLVLKRCTEDMAEHQLTWSEHF